MRLAALLASLLALGLGVSAGSAVTRPAGSLSIEQGRGTIVLRGSGIVIGRLERGEMQIVDLSPLDQWSPRLNGVPRGRNTWTKAKNVNFYVPGGRYRIVIRGEGVAVSARGQGVATLDGKADPAGAAGTFAVGDEAPLPLPTDGAIRVQYGLVAAAPAKAEP